MISTIRRLETDGHALWRTWRDARMALIERPTPARFDACMEAFKPYFIKVVGQGWQEKLDEAMAEERRRCVAVMNAAGRGGRHASPP